MKSPDLKLHLAIVAIIVALSFAWGRYSVTPAKVSASSTTEIDTTRAVDTNRVTVVTETPAGQKSTTITEHIVSETERARSTSTAVVVDAARPILNVSLLAADNINDGLKPLYGVSVSKQIAGPLTAGLFLLSGGTIGVSIGLNF